MKKLIASACNIDAEIVIWKPGDPIRAYGSLIAIDTETLLIDNNDPALYPDVVVLTAFGGGKYVDFVLWKNIPAYLNTLFKTCTKTVFAFHNAPFDIGVLGFDQWVPLIDQGRVYDTGLAFILKNIAENGARDDTEYPSLATLCKSLFKYELEKDSDVRCTFTRDMVLDAPHIIYASKDAVATWKAAITIKYQPTLETQVKGFMVLDSIRRNGLLVDKRKLHDLRTHYTKLMEAEKTKLLSWGIKIDKELKATDMLLWLKEVGINLPWESSQSVPINILKWLLNAILENTNTNVVETISDNFQGLLSDDNWEKQLKKESDTLSIAIQKALPFELPVNKASIPAPSKTQLINIIFYILDSILNGNTLTQAVKDANVAWDDHMGWPSGYKEKGIVEVLQGLMKEAEEKLGIKLPRTETNNYALNEEALSEIDPEQLKRIPFLESYKNYKHFEKLCSTYLSDKYIKRDGRVHSRMCPIMATGRTSSQSPNIQNVAKETGIRELYGAAPGYVLCSCDYNQQELIALAENCYIRYGHSRMRDLINHDIDIHGFMGSTIAGIFKDLPEFDIKNEKLVIEYKTRIKTFKESQPTRYKELRQLSKAADFGTNQKPPQPTVIVLINCLNCIILIL